MTHVRQQVRDAVISSLADLPTTGGNCHSMRTYPRGEKADPALLVYILQERSETFGIGGPGRDLERQIAVTIEAQARGAGFDDTLDQIAAEVETVMFANRKLGGLAIDTTLVETRLELATDRDDRRSGVLILTYQVSVDGPEGNPEVVS
ncbi:hypothetical protein [Roseibium polysiphoniae]|uniref:Gene 25-like lysozyme n=1 Tax=Roseibium polysiphoniae TaxID=2571221 RepID=A0ABR9C6B6_9HYPH|nr:hypothetical protein [Roseibium polysiphoniae]MBD8875433.1 hypothetical protein [Roseibium polysiphoniae]